MQNPNLCVPSRPLRLRGYLFRVAPTSSPNTRFPASANPSTYTQTPYPFACPSIAVGDAGLDTCLPSIEQIEAELGRIGEEESGFVNEKC